MKRAGLLRAGAALAAVTVAARLVSACAGPKPATAGRSSDRAYPGVLHAPLELSPDLVVEQRVEATKDGRTGAFDAVLQKRGGELVVVGLGPLGARAFVLGQDGTEARFEQRMGPPLPFPPRNVLVDVHRAFFKRLELQGGGAPPDGVHRGRLDGEDLVEVWRDGSLVERRFERPGEMEGAVRVIYGAGCRVHRCEPATIHIVNEWFAYELKIENRRFHFFD